MLVSPALTPHTDEKYRKSGSRKKDVAVLPVRLAITQIVFDGAGERFMVTSWVTSPSSTFEAAMAKETTGSFGVADASSEAGPSEKLLPGTRVLARTWKVYALPLTSPVTVWPVVPAPLPEMSVHAP